MNSINRGKTLDELERLVWLHSNFGPHVVQESRRLRTVPIGHLSVEDLRLLIGQGIGLPHLVPLVIERLTENPLAEGAHYRGDLLNFVLALPEAFWREHPALNNEVVEIGLEVEAILNTITDELLPPLKKFQYCSD